MGRLRNRLLSWLTGGKWKSIKEVYDSATELFNRHGNAESIEKKLANIDSFSQDNATLKEQINTLNKDLENWNKLGNPSKLEWELSTLSKIKEDLELKEKELIKAKEQIDSLQKELNNWAKFESISKVQEHLDALEKIKEDLSKLKSDFFLKEAEISNLKKELETWSKFENVSKVEWQLEELKKAKEELKVKEEDLSRIKELVGNKEAIEKIHYLIHEHNGLESLALKLKNYSDMQQEIFEIDPTKSFRDLINDWKERLIIRGLSKKSTDIGNSMGDTVERMLRDYFSNVPNFSWEREKHIIESGKKVDFFFEFRHRKGLFGKVVLENKNGSQWSPRDWKEQITEYVNSTNSFCGILLIPQRQEGLAEIEKGTTIENRSFPIFSFDNVDELKKFLTLILWLSISYTPPKEISDEIDLTLSTDDMHQSISRTCGTICKTYSDFLGGFEDLEKKISTIFKKSKSFQNYILKLKEKILRNKIAVEEELELMQQYSKDKKILLPEALPELFTEAEDEEE